MSSTLRLAAAPRWWAWHLVVLVAVGVMCWLGWWQLSSFEDTGVDRPAAAGPVPLDRLTAPGGRLDAGDLSRVVTAAGSWDAAGQVIVPGRERAGRTGSLVVTPLRTSRGVLPVVRGWVAAGRAAPPPPQGRVDVRAVLQRSETEADATTVLPRRGQVAYVATVTLLAALPYDGNELYDGYAVLRATRPPDPGAPALVEPADQTGQGGGVSRWRNLAYAVQWWLFAAAALVFWALVLRRAAREQGERATAADPDPATGPGSAGPPDAPGAALSAPPRRT